MYKEDLQTIELIDWFKNNQSLLPIKPFELKIGNRVVNPNKFYQSLLYDIDSRTIRLKKGNIKEDLYFLRDKVEFGEIKEIHKEEIKVNEAVYRGYFYEIDENFKYEKYEDCLILIQNLKKIFYHDYKGFYPIKYLDILWLELECKRFLKIDFEKDYVKEIS